MARRRSGPISQSWAMFLIMACAGCVFAGCAFASHAAGSDRDPALRGPGITHAAKEVLKASPASSLRTADDATGTVVGDAAAAATAIALLLAGAAAVRAAGVRDKRRSGTLACRAPPGSYAVY